jgi:cytochrome c3-like protein
LICDAVFHVAREEEPPQHTPPSAALFRPRATTLFRVALLGGGLLVCAVAYAGFQYYRSPYWNKVGLAPDQPVLFSHRHHAAELRIDCRYCHTTVETSASAGMPSTHTCLTCHSQIFTQTTMLRPVVLSAERNAPLHWTRVNSLPDHVYFNHSIHVAKGVGCTTCHGTIGEMPLTSKGEPLTMRWCIDCHRDPGPRLRPESEIFSPDWKASDHPAHNPKAQLRQIHLEHLTNCSSCHH